MALQLRKAGIRHVRPLEGGLEAWRASGYPVEALVPPNAVLAVDDDGLAAEPGSLAGDPPRS